MPKLSGTNSAMGIWVTNFEPFLPGLLTLSSSKVLIASRLFSDLPLPDSPLKRRDEKQSTAEKQENKPRGCTGLGWCIACGGKHCWRAGRYGEGGGSFLGGIAKLCDIFVENRVCVARDVFMGVYDDQGRGINGGIDVVSVPRR